MPESKSNNMQATLGSLNYDMLNGNVSASVNFQTPANGGDPANPMVLPPHGQAGSMSITLQSVKDVDVKAALKQALAEAAKVF